MTWLVASLVYVVGVAGFVLLWARGHRHGEDPEWGLCACLAILWPLILLQGIV